MQTNDFKQFQIEDKPKTLEDFFEVVGDKVIIKGALETDNFIKSSRGVRINREGVNASSVVTLSGSSGGNYTVSGDLSISGALQHQGSTVGFYNVTPVVRASSIGQLTNSTGGSISSTLNAIGNTTTINGGPGINDNFASLLTKVNALEAAIKNIGISS